MTTGMSTGMSMVLILALVLVLVACPPWILHRLSTSWPRRERPPILANILANTTMNRIRFL